MQYPCDDDGPEADAEYAARMAEQAADEAADEAAAERAYERLDAAVWPVEAGDEIPF
jgi:hypothetical protein